MSETSVLLFFLVSYGALKKKEMKALYRHHWKVVVFIKLQNNRVSA